MIDIKSLTDEDKGKIVTYKSSHGSFETGVLSSWNDKLIFVRFKGYNGEACHPDNLNYGPAPRGYERSIPLDAFSAETQKGPE